MFCKRFGTPRGLPKTAKVSFPAHESMKLLVAMNLSLS